MNIEFVVITKRSQVGTGREFVKVATFAEANKIKKNAIDRETYSIIKALERNKDFVQEVIQLRKRFKIPEDVSYETSEEYAYRYKWEEQKAIKSGFYGTQFRRKGSCEWSLNKKFNVPPVMRNSLGDIVLTNCVYLPVSRIKLMNAIINPHEHTFSGLKISILAEVSKNELKKFIDDNYEELRLATQKFSGQIWFTLSDKDLLIYDMREIENKTFREIADALTTNFDDSDGKYNEDSVKTAYHRTKEKIYSLNR